MFDSAFPAAGAAPASRWQARSTVARDVDEHAANLTGWRQRYDQLGGGRFVGRIDEAVSDGVQLFREQTSQRLRQRCEVWPGAVWCGITAADDGSRLDGRRVGAGGIMLSGRSGGFELVSPAGHDIVGFVVARETLARLRPDFALPDGGDATWWPVDPPRRRAALAHARAILALAAAGSAAGADLRPAMLSVFTDLLGAREAPPRERGNACARRRLVAQVHERIEAAPDRVPTVPELCAALHVSRRTLQYAFEEEAGVGPIAFLRSVRLAGVRRMLRAAPPGTTVQQAAAAWGFLHLSAFASDYRRQFGERASDTLAQVGQSSAPRSSPASSSGRAG